MLTEPERARRSSLKQSALVASVCVAIVLGVQTLFVRAPVMFTKIITEDSVAEYFGAIGFCFAAALLLVLASRPGPVGRRGLWVGVGLAFLFVAGEEISWGQRILGFDTPSGVGAANAQGELNVHNLESLQPVFGRVHLVSYVVLAWLALSISVAAAFPRLRNRLLELGIPLVPTTIAPVFLLAPYFWLHYPTAKSEEIAEMFLGISAMAWAVDLFRSRLRPRVSALGMQAACAGLALAAAGLMTYQFSPLGERAWRMNRMAERDYPNMGMFDQSERVFRFIYQHPEYLLPYTRANHARVLVRAGKQQAAKETILAAAADATTADRSTPAWLGTIRDLTRILADMDPDPATETALYSELRLSPADSSAIGTADGRARGMLLQAAGLEARGDICGAVFAIDQAAALAISPRLRRSVAGRMDDLTRTRPESTSACSSDRR